MARINFPAKQEDAQAEPVSGDGQKEKVRGIYWLQVMEASDGKRTSQEAKNKNIPITTFRLEIASLGDGGETPQLGDWVFHNVCWIPHGPGEKAAPGHGIAVHWLSAVKMPYDPAKGFDFDEQDFILQQHCMVKALLEVEPYKSKNINQQTGEPYINTKYVIQEVYSENHPAPAELPPAPKARAPRDAAPGKPAAARAGKPGQMTIDEDVPF